MSLPGLGRPIEVAAWGRTDPGRQRSENQDAFGITEFLDPTSREAGFRLDSNGPVGRASGTWEFVLGSRGALLLVADGMGGAAGGSLASRTAVARINERMHQGWGSGPDRSPGVFAEHLSTALETANAELYRMASADPDLAGMGTTATAVGILDEFLYLAQVGDSRAYLVREGAAVQLTRDQSVVQELMDAGALTPAEAERSQHRNVILQALGTAATVEVDLTYQEVRRGDTVIVCSDGLSGVVTDEELAEAAARFPDPPSLCEALVERANARNSPDNVTAVVARLDGPGLREPRPSDPVRRQALPPPDR